MNSDDVQIAVAIALSVVGIVLCVSALVVAAVYHDRPVIKMSQTWFVFSFPLSLLMLNVYSLLWVLENAEFPKVPCGISIFFFMVGTAYVLSALFAKEFIIWRVYCASKKLTRVEDSSWVFGYTGTMTTIGFGFALAISLTRDESVDLNDYCALQAKLGLRIAAVSFLGMNLVATFVMGYLSRHVPSIAGESNLIFLLAALAVPTLSVSALGARFGTSLNASLVGMVQAVLLLGYSASGTWFLVFRRLKWIDLNDDEVRETFLLNMRSNSRSRTSTTASGNSADSNEADDARDVCNI